MTPRRKLKFIQRHSVFCCSGLKKIFSSYSSKLIRSLVWSDVYQRDYCQRLLPECSNYFCSMWITVYVTSLAAIVWLVFTATEPKWRSYPCLPPVLKQRSKKKVDIKAELILVPEGDQLHSSKGLWCIVRAIPWPWKPIIVKTDEELGKVCRWNGS